MVKNIFLFAVVVSLLLIVFEQTLEQVKVVTTTGKATAAVAVNSEHDFKNPMDRQYASINNTYWATGRIDRDGGPDFTKVLSREVARLPMRDGVELHTEIYRPHNQQEDLPIILYRTPYLLNHTPDGYTAHLRQFPELVAEGYIFVFQDTRGRGQSDGEYVTLGPVRDRSIPNSTDESTDAYDTIEWLINNLENHNGRVGTLGISYGGFLTTRALIDPHPALRAASPQATCADMFVGDDWHHNGAFRLEYAFGWISGMEAGLMKGGGLPEFYDHYESFLALGALSNVNKTIFQGKAKTWNAFSRYPNQHDFWLKKMCGVLPYIQPVTVPTLNVLGWYDAEDFYGPMQVYHKYESMDEHGLNYLVVGPWYHGGWTFDPTGRGIGAIDFDSNTAQYFRNEIHAPWFAYWLKEKGTIDLPEAKIFRTGANQWESYDQWPPDTIIRRNLYLQADGHLSFQAPTESGNEAKDDYISDPANPVPYRNRPIKYAGWAEWQLEDQRLANGRPDVLTYISEDLTGDITITGDPVAHLFAATTGTAADWVVKLIDVYPQEYEAEPYMGGFQFMVAGEVFRARYRNSFWEPEPLIEGEITPYEISLRDRHHTFRKGHRIMVQVQSTWFPLIDRNPQSYVDNIYKAEEGDFISTTHSVFRNETFPSHISLPVDTSK